MGKILFGNADARPSKTVLSPYDVPPPLTTYCSSSHNLPFRTALRSPASTNQTNSAVVRRRDRMTGLTFFYTLGAVIQPYIKVPTPGRGGVPSSRFQTLQSQLVTRCLNTAWFAAGYPRNMGWVTRVQQPETQASGGATSATMNAKGMYSKVQRVPRTIVTPATYQTRSMNNG